MLGLKLNHVSKRGPWSWHNTFSVLVFLQIQRRPNLNVCTGRGLTCEVDIHLFNLIYGLVDRHMGYILKTTDLRIHFVKYCSMEA